MKRTCTCKSCNDGKFICELWAVSKANLLIVGYVEKIVNILDNVRYWETCPEDMKEDIKAIISAISKGKVNG